MSDTSSPQELVEQPMWHRQQEQVLKQWSEIASSYRYMHSRSYKKYSRLHIKFSLPVILLSTLASTINFSTSSFPVNWREYVTLSTGLITTAAGLITTFAQFLKIPDLLEQHRVSSIEFGRLSRNIKVELSLPMSERSMHGRDFLNKCRKTMNELLERSPDIPMEIMRLFNNKFKDHGFTQPDIMEIVPVVVYEGDVEEEKAALKQQLEMEAAAKARREIERGAEVLTRQQKNIKKQTINAEHVSKKLDHLLGNLRESTLGIPLQSSSSDYPSFDIVVEGETKEAKSDFYFTGTPQPPEDLIDEEDESDGNDPDEEPADDPLNEEPNEEPNEELNNQLEDEDGSGEHKS